MNNLEVLKEQVDCTLKTRALSFVRQKFSLDKWSWIFVYVLKNFRSVGKYSVTVH